MKLILDTEKGIIDTENTQFTINEAIESIVIPIRYFGYMLGSDERFSDEMKEELKILLSRAVACMFMSNEEMEKLGFTNGEYIKDSEKDNNGDS